MAKQNAKEIDAVTIKAQNSSGTCEQMVKACFRFMFLNKREKNKQRNKTGASLHDFVVFTINRNFHASIVCSAELPESREFKRSIRAAFEERACTPVFFVCYPKVYYGLLKPTKK